MCRDLGLPHDPDTDSNNRKDSPLTDIATIAAIATAGSALATGLLALATFWLARSASNSLRDQKEQLSVLTYQATAMRAQLDPLLKLQQQWAFKGNKLILTIQNIGNGRAFWVGVHSWCDPCIASVISQDVGEDAKEVKRVQLKATNLDIDRRLVFAKRDVKTASAVSPILNQRLTDEPILDPQEILSVEVEPHFELVPSKDRDSPHVPRWSKFMDFREMRQFLQSNRVSYAALGFTIVCKNAMEDTVYGEMFGQLVALVDEDATLEDVAKRNSQHNLATLGEREVLRMKWFDWLMYDKGGFGKGPQKKSV